MLLGVDTGGTFTDFVLYDGQELRVHKVLSTPAAPEQAILQGIRELGLATASDLEVVHGSTVATNAVLEGKGVRTVFITNYGLRDMLTIGRQARPHLYALNPAPHSPPVPRELCLETGGRITADGQQLEPLTDETLSELQQQVLALAPEAVAVNLLFSYLNDEAERRIAECLPEEIFVSLSSAIMPEYREYERGITTWLNASVGPLVKGYLRRLQQGLPAPRLAVMQSTGGTINAQLAGDQAVQLLLSGPAGGLAGVQYVAQSAGIGRLLSFDMGGTSTDVAMVDGDLRLTTEGRIGPYPVGVPMVDMHTIGAGGGSIARVDAGGLLQVGPESAGADPGPACYGRGGMAATVTDAHLVLGRLREDGFLGGGMSLRRDAAERAIGQVAHQLGISVQATASGIIALANEHMVRALRVMSVQRGLAPAELTLASFGGAGGLHVCALAEALGMSRAMVPIHAGVLSALGMLVAPRVRHLSQTVSLPLASVDAHEMETILESLARRGRAALLEEGLVASTVQCQPSADLRYQGQSFAINLPWESAQQCLANFHDRHQTLYGHTLDLPVEIVTLRMKVQGPGTDIGLFACNSEMPVKAMAEVELSDHSRPVPVYSRESLPVGGELAGPALITEQVSTTYVAPGWCCTVHATGSLLLSFVETDAD